MRKNAFRPFRRSKHALGVMVSLVLLVTTAPAQDTLRYHLDAQTAVATQDYLPHWLTANRFGILNDTDYAVGWLRGGGTYEHRFTERLWVGAGLDLVALTPFVDALSSRLRLQQGYVRVRYGIFELMAGRQECTLGTHAEDLSTGSLSVSGNARPIPQVLLAVPEYSPVPFTKGWVEFKGTFAHGWMGDDRYINHSYLHQKSFFMRFGGSFWLNFTAGLVHNSVWSGERAGLGRLPSGFKDFAQVVIAEGAEGVDLSDPDLLGEAANVLGDHLGVYDFSLLLKTRDYHFLVYHQTPFEDWTGSRLARNRDRLLGINMTVPQGNKWVESVVYEFVYTKYQSGPTIPGGPNDQPGDTDQYGNAYGGRDNYYNNAIYKTGWTYQDRIIGTPLFFTQARTRLYIPDFVDPDIGFNFNIVNNRVVAHHLGIQGHVKGLDYRLLSTFTTNYGTYGGINGGIARWGTIEDPDAPYAFHPPRRQAYFLLEVTSHPFSNQWSLLTSVAVDAGGLTDNLGVTVGLKREGIWQIK